MTLHTKIQEREREFDERWVDRSGNAEFWKVDMFEEPRISITDARAFNRTSSKELLLEIVKEIEGMKKTGIHEFEIGYNRCKFCDEPRKFVDKQSLLLKEDKSSGGSLREVTMTEYDLTGLPCLKNISGNYNQALTDIQNLITSQIKLIEE